MTGNGIQSVELGMGILKAIAEQDKSLSITEISRLCGMSKSKLHRYLTSFCRTGVLEKGDDLKYSLGTHLILLGLMASNRLDVKARAVPYITELREQLNETVALAIWGDNGPFFIRWEESQRAINVGIKVGSQVNVTTTATGKIFAAYLPRARTEHLAIQESRHSTDAAELFFAEMERVRKLGYATTEGGYIPGIAALSCPIFDQNGQIAAAMTVVGLLGAMDLTSRSTTVQTVVESSRKLSRALGFQG